MSYDRFKEALSQIAGGCDNPAGVAAEALRDRRPARKPPAPQPTKGMFRSNESRDRALAIFEEWVSAGRPPFTRLALRHGISGSRINQLVNKGRRILLHPSRKDHPLRDEAVKPLRGDAALK